jgi:hypothetical protein
MTKWAAQVHKSGYNPHRLSLLSYTCTGYSGSKKTACAATGHVTIGLERFCTGSQVIFKKSTWDLYAHQAHQNTVFIYFY